MNTLVHEEAYRGADTIKRIALFGRIVVCGCGAVGSNLIDNLVRQGFKNITTIDFDRVEDHNRHTQIWGRKEMGHAKVAVMKNRIFTEHGIIIEDIPKKLDESNILKLLLGACLVVDGFDNSESRKIVTDHCRKFQLFCLHVGMNGDYAEVMWNDVYKVPKGGGKDVCDYPLARNLVLLAVSVATEAIIRLVDKGVKENYTITLGDFGIRKYEE
jgi:molybdopterin/thiamine biosynthesis adenylyltransferase